MSTRPSFPRGPVESSKSLLAGRAFPAGATKFDMPHGYRAIQQAITAAAGSPGALSFHAAFGLGEDDRHVNSVDADGVALAAIQGLNEQVEEGWREAESRSLKRRTRGLSKDLPRWNNSSPNSTCNPDDSMNQDTRIPRQPGGDGMILTLTILTLLSLGTASAQNAINWSTMDGGGGTSTGAVYSASGTKGHPDAGEPMTGGSYSLTSGFWSQFSAVQTPGARLLAIAFTSTDTALVSWPSASTGFTLQQNTNGLGTVNWSNVIATPTDNGTRKYIIVNPPAGNRFYSLFHNP